MKTSDKLFIMCPYCKKDLDIERDEINDNIICPFCNKEFYAEDNGNAEATDEANDSMDDLMKTFDQMGFK